jgi:hypothetical protein
VGGLVAGEIDDQSLIAQSGKAGAGVGVEVLLGE